MPESFFISHQGEPRIQYLSRVIHREKGDITLEEEKKKVSYKKDGLHVELVF